MKILQINSVCGYGSTGNIVVDLYRILKEQGHECCIAYGRGIASENVQSYRIGSDIDVYAHGILSRITDKQGFYSLNATKRFVEWMKEYDPDVIHLHNLHGYYINIEILFNALKQMDKPVVWTLHDCWAFTGHCAYYTNADCYRWMTGCEHCPQKHSYPTSILLDRSCYNYEKKKSIFRNIPNLTVVTPSKWLAGEVNKSFLNDYPIKVIYNGIDLDIFRPSPSDFRRKHYLEDKKIILGVANVWTKRKGLHVFNDLSKKLDDTYKVVLVGVTRRQQSQVDGRILCIDHTNSKEELAEIYTAADVFLNPSVEETMGLTTVEALACGTNVLVSNCTALPEIVEYDQSKIFSSDDIYLDVVKAVGGMVNESGNRNIASKYERNEQYGKYMELYSDIVKK